MTAIALGKKSTALLSIDDCMANLERKLLEQQGLLNEAAKLLDQSGLVDSVALAARIKSLTSEPVTNVKPVEWYDVVDLPAYAHGAEYLVLAADNHHPCTEESREGRDEKRQFRSSLTGGLISIDDIEAWRPIKDHQPPTGWVACSPAWLIAGGKCAHAPRWYDGKIGNHYHPAL